MPVTADAATTRYFTPKEAAAARQALLSLINGARHELRLIMYGFTDSELIDALGAAHTRGVDVSLILDHTQASGPTEAAMLRRLLLTLPAANVRIGTSPVKHQIIHLKCLVVDQSAVADGSLNWSPTAFEQINDVVVTMSPTTAAAYLALFEEQWAWLSANEAKDQISA